MKERRTELKDKEVLTGVIYNGDSRDALIVREKGPDSEGAEDKPIERITSEPEIIFICKGSARISIDRGAVHTVGAGKMAFLPPGSHTRIIFDSGCEAITLRIDPERQKCLFAGFEDMYKHKEGFRQVSFTLDVNRWMQLYINSLLPFLKDGTLGDHYHRQKVDEFLSILFGYYSKLELTGFFHPVLGEDTVFRYFILRNIREVTSVEQFALRANMSRSGFFHKFTRVYGESPTTYLRRYKAEQILSDLINTDITLQSLATMHGFASYEVFSKFAKKMLGDPPREIRKKARKASLSEL